MLIMNSFSSSLNLTIMCASLLTSVSVNENLMEKPPDKLACFTLDSLLETDELCTMLAGERIDAYAGIKILHINI